MIIPVQNGQLPVGFCPPDYQSMLNGFVAASFVDLTLVSGIVISATPPADHTVAWLQLDSLGNPTRIYFFANGAWLSLHPLPPGFTMIWNQALPTFTTFDGGDANAAPFSSVSGQMWQLMSTTLDGLGTQVAKAQFPIGVGALPAPSAFAVAVGGTGGEEKHVLTEQEMPPHTHTFPIYAGDATNHDNRINTTDETTVQKLHYATESAGGDPTTIVPPNPAPTSALAHNNVPQFYGVYFLQRTNRLYYVV